MRKNIVLSLLILAASFVIQGASAVKLAGSSREEDTQGAGKVELMKILSSNQNFGMDIFDKLLVRSDTPHIFLSETNDLVNAMATDFAEMVTVESIGKSYQGRDINVIRIDGLNYMQKFIQETKGDVQSPKSFVQTQDTKQPDTETAGKGELELKVDGMAVNMTGVNGDTSQSSPDDLSATLVQLGEKVNMKAQSKASQKSDVDSQAGGGRPAILLTAATHSRELITIQTVLFSTLRLLHQALVVRDKTHQNLLMQNVYYIIPVINVDGLNLIEQEYKKTQKIMNKRKNMNTQNEGSGAGSESSKCSDQNSGVDLNRNWGVDFGLAQTTLSGMKTTNKMDECADPCGECYRGPEAFSEPETRALRDFIGAHRNELKWVYNFHSNGNMWVYPFNGRSPNDIEIRAPKAYQLIKEITSETIFPQGMSNNGNSFDLIGEKIGGDQDDYVLAEFGIPSVTVELGREGQFIDQWTNQNAQEAFKICSEQQLYLDYTYQKMGAQLDLQPIKYQTLNNNYLRIFLNVTNLGMSDTQNVPSMVKQPDRPDAASFLQLGVRNSYVSFTSDEKDQVAFLNENMSGATESDQKQAGETQQSHEAPQSREALGSNTLTQQSQELVEGMDFNKNQNESSQVQSDSQKNSTSNSQETKDSLPKDINLASFSQFVHPDLHDIDSGNYWLPELEIVENSEVQIVNQMKMKEQEARDLFLAMSYKDKRDNQNVPLALAETQNKVMLPGEIGNLRSRESKTISFIVQSKSQPDPNGILLDFEYKKFPSSESMDSFSRKLRFNED